MSRKRVARLLGHKNLQQLPRWEDGTRLPSLRDALALSCLFKLPVEILFRELRREVAQEIAEREAAAREADAVDTNTIDTSNRLFI